MASNSSGSIASGGSSGAAVGRERSAFTLARATRICACEAAIASSPLVSSTCKRNRSPVEDFPDANDARATDSSSPRSALSRRAISASRAAKSNAE